MTEYNNLTDGLHHRIDEDVASGLFGIVLATSAVCVWAIVQTQRRSTRYAVLCWIEVVASFVLGAVALAYQITARARSSVMLGVFVVMWSIEVQVYFQLIFQRLSVFDVQHRRRDRCAVFFALLLVNVGTLTIWVPERAVLPNLSQSQHQAIWAWWPRVEKLVYLLVDLGMNIRFIQLVRRQLLAIGMVKYQSLIGFNYQCIAVSLSCDAILLALQWFPKNPKIFVLAHPAVFLVKLILEISICRKMIAISRDRTSERTLVQAETARMYDQRSVSTQHSQQQLLKQPGEEVGIVELPSSRFSVVERSPSPLLPSVWPRQVWKVSTNPDKESRQSGDLSTQWYYPRLVQIKRMSRYK